MENRGFIIEIEKQVLGAILDGGDHSALFGMLDERHFVEPAHRIIFGATKQARDRYSATTLPVVVQMLAPEFIAQFKAEAGVEVGTYLAECTSATVYSAGTATAGARNVIAQWARLLIATEAEAVAAAARSPDADPGALVRSFGATLDEVGSELRRGRKGSSRVTFAQAAAGAIAASREAVARQGLTGITTGLADLDRATGGLQRRDLAVLAARPSMGKTAVGTSVGVSAAKKGHGVSILSLEMDTPKLTTRMCTDLAWRRGVKVPYEAVMNGQAPESDLQSIEWVLEEFRTLPMWIDDASGLSIVDIKIKTEAMAAAAQEAGFSLDLLIVDHLLKVRPTSRYSGNRVNEIGEVTEGLKELAREFDLAVLLLTQLNRQVEQRDDKRPTLADLRDSGAIEQDADTVMFLYREAYYLQREKPATADRALERDADLSACINKAELEIAKQRNGRTQTIELFVDMAYSAVSNVARGGYAEMHERHRG